jgi:hypothetical protein
MPLRCALCGTDGVELRECAETDCSQRLCRECAGPNRTGGLCPTCWRSAIAKFFSVTSFQIKKHVTTH